MARTIEEPHPVDVHVGQRIRELRRLRRVPQKVLAAQLGLTFQQVQKYESGSNRISASKLYDAARVLGVHPGVFFDGLGSLPENNDSELVRLIKAWEKVEENERPRAVITLSKPSPK